MGGGVREHQRGRAISHIWDKITPVRVCGQEVMVK